MWVITRAGQKGRCSRLLNRVFSSRCAASRTPSSPRDLGFRRCVRSSSDGSAFSLVSPLPSTGSAGSGTLSLFAGFFGTMELSDSPETCMSDLWRFAFSDRSASRESDASGVSRLPRGTSSGSILAGQTIAFLVGSNNGYLNNTTGLTASITFNPVPEPSGIFLTLIGVAVLAACCARRPESVNRSEASATAGQRPLAVAATP